MQYDLFNATSDAPLTVLFAGWGMDAEPFRPLIGPDPTAIVRDYTDLTAELPFLNGRRGEELRVIGWSMGVWAAMQVLGERPVREAIAVNGTPWPIDAERGIPPEIFDATLAGFGEAGLTRFRRRMCGGGEALKDFMAHAPKRGTADLEAELRALGEGIRSKPVPGFVWTRAIACTGDRIFPQANQLRAFPFAESRPGAHWDRALFTELLGGGQG